MTVEHFLMLSELQASLALWLNVRYFLPILQCFYTTKRKLKGKKPCSLTFYHVRNDCIFLMGRCHNAGRVVQKSLGQSQTAFLPSCCCEHVWKGKTSLSCAAD